MTVDEGIRFYQEHVAISLHYNEKTDYDYWLYNGKTRASADSFHKSPKRFQYRGLARNVGTNPTKFWYSIYRDQKFVPFKPKKLVKTYDAFEARKADFIGMGFKNDLIKMEQYCYDHGLKLYELFSCVNDVHPEAYLLYKQGMVSWDTLEFIDVFCVSFINRDASTDPILWESVVSYHELNRNFLKRVHYEEVEIDELMTIFKERLRTIKNNSTQFKPIKRH